MSTRTISIILFLIYLADIIIKKTMGIGWTIQLPYTAAYLTLFFAVGFFLISIIPDFKKID